MEKMIICDLTKVDFTLTVPVYIQENEKCTPVEYKCATDSIDEILVRLCHEYNTYTIGILGTGVFANGIAQNIKSYELTTYNENKIKIERLL